MRKEPTIGQALEAILYFIGAMVITPAISLVLIAIVVIGIAKIGSFGSHGAGDASAYYETHAR